VASTLLVFAEITGVKNAHLVISYFLYRSLLDADVSLSQQQVQRYTEVILNHLNCIVTTARDLILVKNIASSLKVFISFFV